MREHDSEPVLGLPERLPEGETILWQGAPSWRPFALRAFHLRGLAAYFALLALWYVTDGWRANPQDALLGGLRLVALGAVPIVLLLGLGKLAARTTLYTITGRRIVMRVGVALPMTVNIPFAAIRSADLRQNRDGTGDIMLRLMSGHRASYFALWPHLRMLRVSNPEPVLRALPHTEVAARALAQALAASAAMPVRALHGAQTDEDHATRPEAAAAA
ncbi:photosynthetic complex putative assembly protein PuhB [Humitalea sp. 24SJ18S-53]|uniref:photosynthetic complex putative assembly protein PuhB n=1 Tax=Humitalea sp. 24SJ18S-53 TaxID=3422307 RepID=UPI003D66EA03